MLTRAVSMRGSVLCAQLQARNAAAVRLPKQAGPDRDHAVQHRDKGRCVKSGCVRGACGGARGLLLPEPGTAPMGVPTSWTWLARYLPSSNVVQAKARCQLSAAHCQHHVAESDPEGTCCMHKALCQLILMHPAAPSCCQQCDPGELRSNASLQQGCPSAHSTWAVAVAVERPKVYLHGL
eukprot:364598-Chlamydomonas_euryale.AAC.3